MCGRTACTLDPGNLCRACSYRPGNDPGKKYRLPEWRDAGGKNQTYFPSHNISPTSITPVLVADTESPDYERIVQPMMWGMVPSWFKGEDPKSHGLTTNNCRVEGMVKSPVYGSVFRKGQRCVVLCEGFYEWQTTKGKSDKQPYFIYMPQPEGVKVEDPETWKKKEDLWSEEEGWKGVKLLPMAGLYSVWKHASGEPVYNYTIITMESNSTLSWLHHRMPAILDSEDAVTDWLESGRVDVQAAYALLKPVDKLEWHPVSSLVNNSRHKDSTCNRPVSLENKIKIKVESASSRFMSNWLKRKPEVKNTGDDCEAEPLKKIKSEKSEDLDVSQQ